MHRPRLSECYRALNTDCLIRSLKSSTYLNNILWDWL